MYACIRRARIDLFDCVDILKRACHVYVMNYLNTIRRVFTAYQHAVVDNNDDTCINENCLDKKSHDLMWVRFYSLMSMTTASLFVKLVNSIIERASMHWIWQQTYADGWKSSITMIIDWQHKQVVEIQWIIVCFTSIDLVYLVINVLRQISIDYLEQSMNSMNISNNIRVDVYKERAQYLERTYRLSRDIEL
jgi:hypothetical protein